MSIEGVESKTSTSVPAPTLLDVLQRPGIQRVFVHDTSAAGVTSYNAAMGSLGDLYAERSLLLAQSGDLVVVDQAPDPAYVRYLDTLGVGPGSAGIVAIGRPDGLGSRSLPGVLATLSEDAAICRLAQELDPLREIRLNPFYTNRAAHRIGQALARQHGARVVVEGGNPAAVALANRKDLMRNHAWRLGVPMAQGELVSWEPEATKDADRAAAILAAVQRRRLLTDGAFVRGVRSMHGSDNLRVTDAEPDSESIQSWLAERPTQHTYLVDPLLSVLASPNVQLWIEDDGCVRLLAITNQRLDESLAHRGNTFPYRTPLAPEITRYSLAIARWLSARGYRGPIGLDFLETRDPRSSQHTCLLAEVNGRINGVTYGLALAERLNQRRRALGYPALACWRSETSVTMRPVSFEEFAAAVSDLLYRHGADAGIVPYNTGLLPHGSVHMVTMGTDTDAIATLERALDARIRAI